LGRTIERIFFIGAAGIVEGLGVSAGEFHRSSPAFGSSAARPLEDPYWKDVLRSFIQLGAILVLPIYFRHHIAKLISTFPEGEKRIAIPGRIR